MEKERDGERERWREREMERERDRERERWRERESVTRAGGRKERRRDRCRGCVRCSERGGAQTRKGVKEGGGRGGWKEKRS